MLVIRHVCILIRPASLTAAAPPSICHVIQSVDPIEIKATVNKAAPIRVSLVESDMTPLAKAYFLSVLATGWLKSAPSSGWRTLCGCAVCFHIKCHCHVTE